VSELIEIKVRHLKILILLIVIIILVAIGGTLLSSMGNNTTKINKVNNSIPNKTFTGSGLTFNYPSEWEQVKASTFKFYTGADLAFLDSTDNNTGFYIKRVSGQSLPGVVSPYKAQIRGMGETFLSDRNITVNGKNAVELIKTWKNNDTEYKAMVVIIEVVPGSSYYRMAFPTTVGRFDSMRSKFDMIVSSINSA
jgi:hypothetical protein